MLCCNAVGSLQLSSVQMANGVCVGPQLVKD